MSIKKCSACRILSWFWIQTMQTNQRCKFKTGKTTVYRLCEVLMLLLFIFAFILTFLLLFSSRGTHMNWPSFQCVHTGLAVICICMLTRFSSSSSFECQKRRHNQHKRPQKWQENTWRVANAENWGCSLSYNETMNIEQRRMWKAQKELL